MDCLASLHAAHGFLNLHHHRKDTNSQQSRAHRGSRSMSLSDRRGLITAPRFSVRKSSISPLPHRKRHDDESIEDSMAMFMHILQEDAGGDPMRSMLLPVKRSSMIMHKPLVWQNMEKTVTTVRAQTTSKKFVGEVLLTLRYHVAQGLLSVDIIQAKDIIGRQNCRIFLSIQLIQNHKILRVFETSSKTIATKIPFKENFIFHMPYALLDNNNTNLLVKAYQDTKNADEIGHFIIGPQGSLTGAQHWKQIFNYPNTSFSAWHKLISAMRYPNVSIRT